MVDQKKLRLHIRDTSLGYRLRKPLLKSINLSISSDETFCILGQNGTGKTTFFKSLLGILPPLSGSITLNGKPLGSFSRKELAKLIAYVPQAHHTPFPYKVNDVILFGRTAHMNFFGSPGRKDLLVVDSILDMLEISHLADCIYTELSGGERQMVVIARALAQEAGLLILDEPASNLDYGNQARLLKKIRALAEAKTGILMTTHQPDQAFLLDAKVLMLSNGSVLHYDDASDALQPDILKKIYGVNVEVIEASTPGKNPLKVCRPLIDT